MKKYLTVLTLLFAVLIFVSGVQAKSKLTKTQRPSKTAFVTPTELHVTITTKITQDPKTNLYTVVADWDDVPGAEGYSAVLNKTPNSDPGARVKTTQSSMVFKNVTAGKKYLNLKAKVNGKWSMVQSEGVMVGK
jgi:hypothetical protein